MIKLLKPSVFALSLIPLLRWFYLGFTEQLGANPVEFVTRSTGTWTLVLLCCTLAVTPVRKWTGFARLASVRRMLGLFTFFYATLHFTTYSWLDKGFILADIVKDIFKRPFITVGFAAFVLLIPLALTSHNRLIKLLGAVRWQQLHRLVYLIAVLAVLHYWWHKAGKHDFTQPLIYGLVILALFAARGHIKWKTKQKA